MKPLILIAASTACVFAQSSPTVTIQNGTVSGLYQPTYNQDLFLGVPFAQPPLGELRLNLLQPFNATWNETQDATAYYPECIGYGGDQVGYDISEDCMALNIVRPAGYEGQSLPVGVWIHGGGYVMGGAVDRRYNLSFIVQNSVSIGKPIIGVSIPYRLSAWGFLDSQEVRDAGVTNLGIRDQRFALQWIQENIAAFGGDPSKVTIWGESAGAGSVGIHLIAYNGRDDGLFSGAIAESGNPILLGNKYNISVGQAIFDNITDYTNCSSQSSPLSCLRSLSFEDLNSAINRSFSFYPYRDDDLIQGSQHAQLLNGSFIKVPLLIGANNDEGSAFGTPGIDNDTAFLAAVSSEGFDNDSTTTLATVYPNLPALTDVLYNLTSTPNSTYGAQWKRVAAFAGDLAFHAARRLTCQSWSQYNASAYCYRFNTPTPYNISVFIGTTHFEEVAHVFNNIDGLGYETGSGQRPFPPGTPDSYLYVSGLMSRMWASFIHDGTPNGLGNASDYSTAQEWPVYNVKRGGLEGTGQFYQFDALGGSRALEDTYRGAGIAYMNTLWESQLDK